MQLYAPQIALAILMVTYYWLMIYVPAEVTPASVFERLCKLLYTKPMLNSELQRYTAELQDRVPLQAQSALQVLVRSRVQLQMTVSAGTGISWRLLPLKPIMIILAM